MWSIDPSNGARLREYAVTDSAAIDDTLDRATAAFHSWSALELEERAQHLRRVADTLRGRSDELAVLMADEMGKPLEGGTAEVEKCAWVCEFYADHAPAFLADEPVPTEASKSFVAFNPLGVVLAVMPWNFPLWQVFRFAAPALMAGNTAILKHASNVPGSALAIEELFASAGLPAGAFSTLLIPGSAVASLISDDRVAAVTLTGSTAAGRSVASAAGQALKKSVLELGGSDAYVILPDADLPAAAAACATGRLINGGQSCVAAKRFVVLASIKSEFETLVSEAMGGYTVGDPKDEGVDIGPMARHDLRDELHQQVEASVSAGAKIILGGKVPDSPGAFYPPTILTDVRAGMPAYHEEFFGPVASIIAAEDVDDAIRIANDTSFGLGAAVFTQDLQKAEKIAARRLQAGACFVNTFVRSDPRLPFGGIKESGYGRELSSFGIREFVNIKAVYIQ